MELVRDRDRLVAALHARGIDYLAPSDAEGEPLSDEELIASLASGDDPRLRSALTALCLLHPEKVSCVQAVLGRVGPAVRDELVAR